MQERECKEESVVYSAFGAYVQCLHFSVFRDVQNELTCLCFAKFCKMM